MSIKLTSGNYVKFVRTTAAVWNSVDSLSKDSDTLYFVLSQDHSSGDLYLGSTLITGVTQQSLGDLQDVIIDTVGGVADGSLLVYSEDDDAWEPMGMFDVLQGITNSLTDFVGATASANGQAGLVPAPVIAEKDYFLGGNGSWVNPAPVIQTVINTSAASWFGNDWDSQNGQPNQGITIRQIAADAASVAVAGIINNAPASFDTLKEIADWIGSHSEVGDLTTLTTRVTNLETTVNGRQANPETGAAAVVGLVTKVGNLETAMTAAQTSITTIENTLKWQDMTIENDD